jgi:hypothetical protein
LNKNEFEIPLNPIALKANGNIIFELSMSMSNNTMFPYNAILSLKRFNINTMIYAPETRVVTICDEKDNYRFGYTGGEKLNEIMGIGNYVDLGERGIDTRIGRLNWRPDPLAGKFPYQSPYVYAGNNPIFYVDKKGAFKLNYNEKQLKEQGLTKVEVARFENIVTNIYKLVADNHQALDAIANTTGFSQERIKSDFQLNNGPTISILGIGGGARGGRDGIVIDPSVIKHLASISRSDKANLSEQTLGMALTIIHEYGHYGDQVTNEGKNTGQYILNITETSKGKNTNRKYYSEVFGGNNIDKGKQKWNTSLTGHRGTDIEVMGFGTSFSIDDDGKHVKEKAELSPTTSSEYHNQVPTALPNEAQGDNVLKTLKVE